MVLFLEGMERLGGGGCGRSSEGEASRDLCVQETGRKTAGGRGWFSFEIWADEQELVNLIQRGTLWEKCRSEKGLRLDVFKLSRGFLDVRSCWEVNILRKVCCLLAAECVKSGSAHLIS